MVILYHTVPGQMSLTSLEAVMMSALSIYSCITYCILELRINLVFSKLGLSLSSWKLQKNIQFVMLVMFDMFLCFRKLMSTCRVHHSDANAAYSAKRWMDHSNFLLWFCTKYLIVKTCWPIKRVHCTLLLIITLGTFDWQIGWVLLHSHDQT